MFQKMLQINFSPFQLQKQSQKSYKRGIFLILHFGWQANGGAIAPPPRLPPPDYATDSCNVVIFNLLENRRCFLF